MSVRREVTASNRWEVRKCGRVRDGKEGGAGGRKRGSEDRERGEIEKIKRKERETGKDPFFYIDVYIYICIYTCMNIFIYMC